MNDLQVEDLIGQEIRAVHLKMYATIGLDYIAMVMASGRLAAFVAEEIPLGRYETYTLARVAADRSADKELPIGLKVEEILILEREEWLLPVEQAPGLVGNNPSQTMYGPIGSAPPNVTDVVPVICGIRFSFGSAQRSLLIYVDENPGLISLAYPDDQERRLYSLATVTRRIR